MAKFGIPSANKLSTIGKCNSLQRQSRNVEESNSQLFHLGGSNAFCGRFVAPSNDRIMNLLSVASNSNVRIDGGQLMVRLQRVEVPHTSSIMSNKSATTRSTTVNQKYGSALGTLEDFFSRMHLIPGEGRKKFVAVEMEQFDRTRYIPKTSVVAKLLATIVGILNESSNMLAW